MRAREPFYLYQLGLKDVCRGVSAPQATRPHPDVISRQRRPA
ncbi:hypothetical protein HNQ07_000888 [Deinococcus metalli]|uniref:Uncharacterized protein n=1 Tax=Deinococcus metalli TaxID=1141878 RepID=A0A7W8KC35_9DEIO|nr:hypothetical protein [Deinococcus metalli]MBB5375444.1 hypothetical protein [Deinococcus metalli]